jgi:hypothetical protein
MQHLRLTSVVSVEVSMVHHSNQEEKNAEHWSKQEKDPAWANAFALVVWLPAAVVAFLPFALNTSPRTL